MKTRQEALALLHDWVKSESLRRHCLAVASAMEAYAKKNNLSEEEVDLWWITGLLHDFDWEKYPTLEQHPIEGCKKLRELEYDDSIIEAILGHNKATGIKRYSLMAKTLFAVDELSGLIVALAKVRPGNFERMNAESVKKSLKKKDFAAAISREDIYNGMEELEIDSVEKISEHLELVVNALAGIKRDLEFS